MAYNGWFSIDGNEFINTARTEEYARADGAPWFYPTFRNPDLAKVLGDDSYSSPMQDDAPWTDPNDPSSYDFYGVYPLDVTGLEDSTRSSVVIESILDGGIPGRLRHGTRSIVFKAVLIGASDAAVDFGMKWLKSLLLAGGCTPVRSAVCDGSTLCYFAAEPPYTPGQDLSCSDEFRRSLLRVGFTSGPVVDAKNTMSDGSAVWTIQFTAVAGIPWEFGQEQMVALGFLDPTVSAPLLVDTPYDPQGYIYTEISCARPPYVPVTDPLCPALIPPPAPPAIPLGCFTLPKNWRRRQLVIPQEMIPLWSDAVPRIAIHAVDADVRNIRFRFYPDPTSQFDPGDDPCSYCGDLVVSYIQQGGTLIIDGSSQTVVYETLDGNQRRADTLVYASDGSPFEWPLLSCGYNYIVTVDSQQTQVMPSIDLSVFNRAS